MKILPLAACLALAVPTWAATGSNVAIDAQGNIWRTGQNLPVPLTANAFQKTEVSRTCASQQVSPFDPVTYLGCSHAYVMKQDPQGNVLYATFLGGSSEDGGIAITTDAAGNAYVAGFTYSADFPVTAGAAQTHNAGPSTVATLFLGQGPYGPVEIIPGGDTFVAKFAPDGTLLYSTLLGGSGEDVPALIGADAAGSAYVAGTTSSTDFPVTPNGFGHTNQFTNFFARLNAQGTSLVSATYSDPSIRSFDVDNDGNAFLTGDSVGPGSEPYAAEIATGDGQVVYTTSLTGMNSKYVGSGAAIAADGSGGAWVGVSPAEAPSYSIQVNSPPAYPLGPSFLLKLAAGGGSVAAEIDIGNAQFDSILLDTAGNAYAFGHGTGTLPAAAAPPSLAAPCSSSGGNFVFETNAAGKVTGGTYLRQGGGSAAVVEAPAQIALYSATYQTVILVDLTSVPAMNFGCPVNLGSGEVGPGLAPGEIFAIFGSGIGPAQTAVGTPDASGKFPTLLAGVKVSINGTAVPLIMAQAGEIHGVVPFAYSYTLETVEVHYQDQAAPPLDAPMSTSQTSPGIFVVNGQGAILNQDETVNSPANPAKLGSIVSIYATGTGPLSTSLGDGSVTPIPPPYDVLQLAVQVTFDNVAGEVLWAGSAPGLIAGVTQINVQLPADLPEYAAGASLAAVPVVLNSSAVLSAPAMISLTR